MANKAELTLDTENLYHDCLKKYSEMEKIYGFIDLPEHVSQLERNNSKILRVYYANALDHNLIDINTVKYIVDGKIKPKAIAERGIEQYIKAEDWLNTQLNSPLSISMLYHLQKLLIVDLYNNREDVNLFSANTTRFPEKLNNTTELEIDALFEFLNNDTEVHPIMQSWMLHFKLLQLHLFSEANAKIACLLQNFWLTKKQFNFMGLLSLEHELYINKTEYQVYLGENRDVEKIAASEEESISFGMQIFANQILRLKTLLRTYFRRQVEFDKLGPRQKNIMNYVFEHGYLLKEYDDNVLNQRQKLIMYIIQHRGFISTKELVSEFECNRKTIQRDFTTLLELNLVKVIGKGAGLKYAVNVTEHKHEYLNKYQSPLVAENTEMSHEA
ncbi:MAG: HTH domain-containing protein [Bacteroidia bacterium]|nr:HTH domain-containing protein [Bacteroidia bacterium]